MSLLGSSANSISVVAGKNLSLLKETDTGRLNTTNTSEYLRSNDCMALMVQTPTPCSLAAPTTVPANTLARRKRKRKIEEEEEDCLVAIPALRAESGPAHSCVQQHHSGTGSVCVMEPPHVQGEDKEPEETLANGPSGECCQPTTTNDGTAEPAGVEQQTTRSSGGKAEDESHLTLRDEVVDKVWDDFATNFLAGSCHIQQAAIFDLASRRPLAVSGGLQVSAEEMEQLVASLHQLQLAYRNGVTIGGKTYKVKLADGRNGILARSGSDGCTVCKTHTLIIIGVHDHKGNSRKCNEDVMRLGDFFRWKAV